MKISKGTLELLQSFAGISSNLLIKPGSKLSIRNAVNSVQARAEVEETFPVQVPIYDLNQLLGLLNISHDPDLEFGEKSVVIRSTGNGGGSIEYFYADASLINAPPETPPTIEEQFTFELSAAELITINKTAGLVGASTLAIQCKKGKVTLLVNDPKSKTSNSYKNTISAPEQKSSLPDFDVQMDIESLRMAPDTYKVSVAHAVGKENSKVLVFYFKATNRKLTYIVAANASSKF